MKVIPKLQSGGYAQYFNHFLPMAPPTETLGAPAKSSNSAATQTSKESKSSDKDDLINIFKLMDGLPNEMSTLLGLATDLTRLEKLAGNSSSVVTSSYLLLMYQIKVANNNKKQYDEALKAAKVNGAMNEPAISPDGKLIAQNSKGDLVTISLEDYAAKKGKYKILSVSNLANLRAYDTKLSYNIDIFNIIENSMGYEAFLKLLQSANILLASSSLTREGLLLATGNAIAGLLALQDLKGDPRLAQIVGNITLPGLIEYNLVDKSNAASIKAYVGYLKNMLPERAKTWAAFKVGIPDKEKAIEAVVMQYLLGRLSTESTVKTTYKGSIDKVMGKSGSGSGKDNSPEHGFWALVMRGENGTPTSYKVQGKHGSFFVVNARYVSKTPGMENNVSLSEYLSKSGVPVNNTKAITFGDALLRGNSFSDIMVKADSGAYIATLPLVNGHVDFTVLEAYNNAMSKLVASGISPNSPLYLLKKKEIFNRDPMLAGLLKSDGTPNKSRFGNFLMVEGMASEKTKGSSGNGGLQSFKDLKLSYVQEESDDSWYGVINKALSTDKEKNDYKLSSGTLGFFSDKLYSGVIYIPLSTNPLDAQNADKSTIKENTAHEWSALSLAHQKLDNMSETNSELLDE